MEVPNATVPAIGKEKEKGGEVFADVTHSGYLGVQVPQGDGAGQGPLTALFSLSQSALEALSLTDKWKRLFFVIRSNSLLFYYKDRPSFLSNPGQPVNMRPVELRNYSLRTDAAAFSLFLVPERAEGMEQISKRWHFRCDTAAEFDKWMEAFSAIFHESKEVEEEDGEEEEGEEGGEGGGQVDD